MQERRGIDKSSVAIIISEHRRADDAPDLFVHQLEFVKNEFVGIIAAQGIRIPSGFCSNASFCSRQFKNMPSGVFVKYLLIDGVLKYPAGFNPEPVYLIDGWRGI